MTTEKMTISELIEWSHQQDSYHDHLLPILVDRDLIDAGDNSMVEITWPDHVNFPLPNSDIASIRLVPNADNH